jgi:tetratricopeptide (TPR) repeat protein
MRLRDALIVLLLAAITLVVYAQVRTHEFVNFDDYIYVVDNPNMKDGLDAASIARAFVPYAAYWIPLTWLSLLVDRQIYGLDPTGYLLTNVALHLLNTILLYFLLARMTRAPWRSAFVAAVFAVHPLHVESVAWVTERKDVLSVFFGMLTLHVHVWRARKPSFGRGILVAVPFVLALLSKPSLVTLPVVLLLLDYWPLGRFRLDGGRPFSPGSSLRRALTEKIPLFVMSVAVGAVAIATQAAMGGMEMSSRISTLTRIVNAFGSFLEYLATTFWPSGLAVVYPMPLEMPTPEPAILGAAILVLATLAVLSRAASRPWLAVGWLWFLVTLAPVSGFLHVGVQARADRFMYVPLIGLSILVTWLAADLVGRSAAGQVAAAVAGSVVVAALAAVAYRQAAYWHDTVTLFERAVAVTHENYFAHNRLAEQYKSQLRLDQAEAEYAETIRIDPGWVTPQLQLASMKEAMGDLRTASIMRDAAAHADANPDLAAGFLGVAWMQAGRFRFARPLLERAVAAHPEHLGTQNALGIVLSGLGDARGALEHFNAAMRLDPDHPATATNRAWLLATSPDDTVRNPEEAVRVAEAGLVVADRLEFLLLDGLAAAHAAAGRFDQAITVSARAAELAAQRGDPARAAEIQRRIDLYRQGRAFQE